MEFPSKLRLFYVPVHGLIELVVYFTAGPKALDKDPAQPQAENLSPKDPTSYVKPLSPGQYILEFNRSPVVGYRLRLNGIYDEARIQFTRPRNWQTLSVKMMVRYRHSPALYATRSNLTLLVNGNTIGSVPLNKKKDDIGTAVFEIPTRLIENNKEIVIAALQNNSPTCTQDFFNPSLRTEVRHC